MAVAPGFPKNPYIIGTPIHDPVALFGREDLFDFLNDNLSHGAKVIVLSGQRRIGKSSVLLQVPNKVDATQYACVLFDLQNQAPLPLAAVLGNLGQSILQRLQLGRELAGKLPPFRELDREPDLFLRGFLPAVFQAIGSKKLVLLLDEFDLLNDPRQDQAAAAFFPFLQRAIYELDRLYLVPVVGRRLDELTYFLSLFRGAPHEEIGLLAEPQARRLIVEPAREALDYAPEAIRAILDLSAGHPYFTQLLCHEAFAATRAAWDGRHLPQRVEAPAVAAVVDKAIERGEGGLAWFHDNLPVPEKVIFSAVAESQTSPSDWTSQSLADVVSAVFERFGIVKTGELLRAADRLLERGFVRRQERTTWYSLTQHRFVVTVDLVRRWLRLRRPLRDVMRQLETTDPEAIQLFQDGEKSRQGGDLTWALKLYEKALRINPNHFAALIELADAWLRLANYPIAVQQYERINRFAPAVAFDGYVEALLGSGQEASRHGRLAEAWQSFTKVLELDPNNQVARGWLAKHAPAWAASVSRNPFVVGPPVPEEQFVGRTSELESLLERADNGTNVALCGELGSGKTSLLWRLMRSDVWEGQRQRPPECTYLNCEQTLEPDFSVEAFWTALGRAVRESVRGIAWPTDGLNAYEQTRRFFGALHRQEKRALVILDDFDFVTQFSSSPLLLNQFRALIQQGQSVSFVISMRRYPSEVALPQPPQVVSPWFNVFMVVALGTFNPQERQQLIDRMPPEYPLGSAELAWIEQVAGGYPFLLQAALSTLFNVNRDRRRFDPRQESQAFAAITESFFASVWRLATGPERAVMTLIASLNLEQRTGLTLSNRREAEMVLRDHERALRALEQRNLLFRSSPSYVGPLTLVSSILEWWIVKECESQPEAEVNAFAQTFELTNPQPTQVLAGALTQVARAKPAYHAIERWVNLPT